MNLIARPRIVEQQISTQQAGPELLVYDERRHQAFCLNATSAAVWKLCDGQRTVAQIAADARLDGDSEIAEQQVLLAIDQLRADGLIEEDAAWVPIPDLSRRQMIQRLTAGAVLLLPVVATVMAPKAYAAYNGCADCDADPARTGKTGQLMMQHQKAKSSSLFVPDSAPADTDSKATKSGREGQIFVP